MPKIPRLLLLASLFVLTVRTPLHAQAQAPPPGDANPAAPPTPTTRAPDEMTKKITDLYHAGKYAEALQLTNGLLIAYPNDQRLVKAKALIDGLLASSGSTGAAPASNQPTQPAANANIEQLTGMDKVDYNALIVLARQAQQTTDLDEQKKLLQQFMDQSSVFLQKHPDLMLLWQLRAASAISLDDPLAGYEAGQKLLTAGAADSNDPALQQLLGQVKNKGWMDKQGAEDAAKQSKYGWILGNWTIHYSWTDERGGGFGSGDGSEEFTKASTAIEGFYIDSNGTESKTPNAFATILDSGDLRWQSAFSTFEISDHNRKITIVFSVPNGKKGEQTTTWLLHKD